MGVVYVGQIAELLPIERADRLELARVFCGDAGTWLGVVKKNDFTTGQQVETYLQDALLPHEERFSFMEKRHWRVSMARFRGAPSECLIMPLSINGIFYAGKDITEAVGATKYEKPIPVQLRGRVAGSFPSFVPKTDQPNFQAVPKMVAVMRGSGLAWVASEKVDGTSCTAFLMAGAYGVCSRNWQKVDDGNIYYEMAKKYHVEAVLKDMPCDIAIQFEIVGPGIQKNPLGLTEVEIRVFDIYDIHEKKYLDFDTMSLVCFGRLPVVSEVASGPSGTFPQTDEELRKLAIGKYSAGGQREGVVIRPMYTSYVDGERVSFKVLSLGY